MLAKALPFQAEALLWDPWQPLWLVLIYLTLSTPFFCAANAIGLALIAFRDRAGRVYAADLVGAGLGSVIVLALLYWLWPEEILRVIAAAGLVAMCVGAVELRAQYSSRRDRRLDLRTRGGVWIGVAVLGLAAIIIATPTALLRFEPGPYKATEPGTADRWHACHARAVESAGPRQRDRKSARAAAFGARA